MNKEQLLGFKVSRITLIIMMSFVLFLESYAQVNNKLINDVTKLTPILVDSVICPKSTHEIIQSVINFDVVSIGGGRYSMGGQTATEKALQIDMRKFDSIVGFSKENKEISVQTGITWRRIQEFIDPFDLSIKIMQTYANFTVGGSLSVNVHGRYIGEGPLILSVKKIKVIIANGELIEASPLNNSEVFFAAIGGYGGLGVIVEATLSLTDNCKIERRNIKFNNKLYPKYFLKHINNDTSIVFHNADIYPNKYRNIRAVSYYKTTKAITVKERLRRLNKKYTFNRLAIKFISNCPGGKWIRQFLIDPITYLSKPVEWRNYEASYDVLELEPKSRLKSTYVLQEYFVPVDSFDVFYSKMVGILKLNKVNVLNISVRHAKKDLGTYLAWARYDVFAFVIYYKQGVEEKDKFKVKKWTRELIDVAINSNGTYYLPYQIHASNDQFLKAYPNSSTFFEIKKKYDPKNKFRNKLWDSYYKLN